MKTLILIPARGGSQGIHRKNLVDLCGKPLIWWTIQQAVAADVGQVVVSSDDDEILLEACRATDRVEAVKRPAHLATDEATTESVMLYILDERPACDSLIVLQPTSPLRLAGDIQAVAGWLGLHHTDSVVSVVKSGVCLWETTGFVTRAVPKWPGAETKARLRRQDMPPQFAENGAIYGVRAEPFLRDKLRFCGELSLYQMPPWTRHEIDSPEDLGLVRTILRQRMEQGSDGVRS